MDGSSHRPRCAHARRVALLVPALALLAGCSRSPRSLPLIAAFSEESEIGRLTASWHETGAERATPGGAEREVAFRVDAVNAMPDRVFVRLRDFRLLGGGELARERRTIECTLVAGDNPAILRGTLWIPQGRLAQVRGFDIDRLAVPLSERGRAFYREFLRQQRPGDEAAIAAEIDAYARAPSCASGG